MTKPDHATQRLQLYRRDIVDPTDDDEYLPIDFWFAMQGIHLIAWATVFPSGIVCYISVVSECRRHGFGLEFCLALNQCYGGSLTLENTMPGGGDELAVAFERERKAMLSARNEERLSD